MTDAADRSFRRALVLGGSGFLGRAITAALRSAGVESVVVGRRPRGDAHHRVVDVQTADLYALLDDVRPDVVFHLASNGFVPPSIDDPFGDLVSNAGSTARLLDAVRRRPGTRPAVVIASSAAVYGNGIEFPMTEDHPRLPVSPYGVSKLAAEEYASYFSRAYGVPTLCVRPFSLYGPGQEKLVVYDLARRMLAADGPITIAAPADVTRDFLYIDDAARMAIRLAERAPANGEAYNLCTGRATSLCTVARALARLTDSPEPQFTGVARSGDPTEWCGDPSRAAALGARAAVTLDDGLAATVEWIESSRGGS